MFIWKHNQKRCNPYAPYTDEQGTRYNKVPSHLYEEIADPGHGDEQFYYNTEQDEAPYLVVTPKSVESIREVLRANVDALRDDKEKQGFPYLGKMFHSDERSVQRINTAVQAAQVVGPTYSVEWKVMDKTYIPLDQAAMLMVPVALAVYANGLHIAAKNHKAAIDAADFDTLKTYNITTGWAE